jgi:hypothetical protein
MGSPPSSTKALKSLAAEATYQVCTLLILVLQASDCAHVLLTPRPLIVFGGWRGTQSVSWPVRFLAQISFLADERERRVLVCSPRFVTFDERPCRCPCCLFLPPFPLSNQRHPAALAAFVSGPSPRWRARPSFPAWLHRACSLSAHRVALPRRPAGAAGAGASAFAEPVV